MTSMISRTDSFTHEFERCDGSHIHGPCAGKETRVTQLYTELIVKIILKGVKNQMLLNNAYGIKRNLKPKKPQYFQALTCVRVNQGYICQDEHDQQGLQFLHFLYCVFFKVEGEGVVF